MAIEELDRTTARTSAPWRAVMAAGAAALLLTVGAACSSDDEDDGGDEDTEQSTTTSEAEPTTSTTSARSGTTLDATDSTGSAGTAVPADLEPDEEAITDEVADPWSLNAADYRDQIGLLVAYDCPPEGTARSVWGGPEYTDDSSVCTAAVHAGLIDLDDGGRVIIEMTEGLESYEASTANGVEAGSWGAWGGSFVFPLADS